MMVDQDDFGRWLAQLRERVACGNLVDVGPVHIHDGSRNLPMELLVRTMIADLDHLNALPPDGPDRASVQRRQQMLLRDFRRLREQIGELPPESEAASYHA